MTFILEAKNSSGNLVFLATCEDANSVTTVAQKMVALPGVVKIEIERADRPEVVRDTLEVEQPVQAAPTVDTVPVAPTTTDSKSKNGG